MTHIDPRLDKLVEAADAVISAQQSFSSHKRMKAFEKLVAAVYEASTPLKEFAGMDHDGWQLLYLRINSSDIITKNHGGKEQLEAVRKIVKMLEPAACRQIAEGLEL